MCSASVKQRSSFLGGLAFDLLSGALFWVSLITAVVLQSVLRVIGWLALLAVVDQLSLLVPNEKDSFTGRRVQKRRAA